MKDGGDALTYPLKDLTILDEIREIFYKTTGLAVSFHYPGTDEYDFYPLNEKNSYCRTIQSTKQGLTRCLKSDRDALRQARETGKSCIYTCHAGLTNAVLPLVFRGRYIGAIFTGQIFTEKQAAEDFLRLYERLRSLNLDREALITCIRDVKVLDREQLLLGINLLNVMANYILSVEDELSLKEELHRKEEEILKYENDLQQLSINVLRDRVGSRGTEPSITNGAVRPEQQQTLVIRAQEFIQKNYSKNLSLSEVAKAVYLSPNYFSSLFKERTGLNFTRYLNNVRIQEGKRLLRESDMPIKQIYRQVGFRDYNYFNRVFRKSVGIPPGTYRETFVLTESN